MDPITGFFVEILKNYGSNGVYLAMTVLLYLKLEKVQEKYLDLIARYDGLVLTLTKTLEALRYEVDESDSEREEVSPRQRGIEEGLQEVKTIESPIAPQ